MKRVLLLLFLVSMAVNLQANGPFVSPHAVGGGDDNEENVSLFEAEVVTKEFKNILNIDIKTTSEQAIKVEVHDENGKVVFSDKLMLYGVMFKKIYTDDYPSGTYKVIISCKDQEIVQEAVKH